MAYRILHVEDSPDDAELIARALARARVDAEIDRVDTEGDYVAKLEQRTPDVILCDYDMPRFSAERALAVMRERSIHVPFIVVSNHIGQNAAVIAMQGGASDYLSKRDLGRLPKAIEVAVDRAEARRERARAERALRESEAMMRGILESLDSRIAVLDRSGTIVAVNGSWERFDATRLAAGYNAAGVGDNYLALLDDSARQGLPFAAAGVAAARMVITREQPFASVDYRLDTPGGSRWFIARITPLEGSDGGIVVAHQDITDNMLAHVALESAHHRLQALSKRVLSIQEDERRAIARELHDDAGQSLAALKIGLHRLAQQPAQDPKLLADCTSTAEAVIEKLRTLAQELRPPQLDQLGLADALRWLVERQQRATGIAMRCDFPGAGDRRYAPALEAACYRIAQEAINNATRHAGPRNVTVTVDAGGELLRLVIQDDGAGFDEAAARARALKGGSLGLISMEERAELAGGRLHLQTVPGVGTTICALFPLEAG
jgi:two-component system sensor histidine kinase UhpB